MVLALPRSGKVRILIVDDEEDITLVLKKGLERHGFEVVTFNDPLLALTDFRADLYDLILLDIKMPKIDGFELYQRMKKVDANVRICFMTAFEVYFDALKEIFPDSYSSICFVRKPFEISGFVKRIAKEVALDRA